jgi:HSP20 family protein
MSYEERDKDIVFTIDMPGVEKKDIDIKVEDHSITVKAENGIPIEGTKHGRKYNYTRKFRPTVDIDSAVATFKNGVLDITLTKIEEASKGKSVKIK